MIPNTGGGLGLVGVACTVSDSDSTLVGKSAIYRN